MLRPYLAKYTPNTLVQAHRVRIDFSVHKLDALAGRYLGGCQNQSAQFTRVDRFSQLLPWKHLADECMQRPGVYPGHVSP